MSKYADYGLLVNYRYCTGCHSCEVACQEEKDLEPTEFGIKVLEKGPYKQPNPTIDNAWDWSYIPIPTDRCDLCAERLDAGKKPMCVKHCLALCMDFGPIEELSKKALELGEQVFIVKPH